MQGNPHPKQCTAVTIVTLPTFGRTVNMIICVGKLCVLTQASLGLSLLLESASSGHFQEFEFLTLYCWFYFSAPEPDAWFHCSQTHNFVLSFTHFSVMRPKKQTLPGFGAPRRRPNRYKGRRVVCASMLTFKMCDHSED